MQGAAPHTVKAANLPALCVHPGKAGKQPAGHAGSRIADRSFPLYGEVRKQLIQQKQPHPDETGLPAAAHGLYVWMPLHLILLITYDAI